VSYCVFWIVVTLALIIMRVDEKRVSQGQATMWRALWGKGPKPIRDGHAALADVSDQNSINKANIAGMEREIQNPAV
jgi:hypothetical protein